MGKRVLVIDDEENVRDLIKTRLESHDFYVVTAFDGVDGIAKLDDERPDLIVLDLIMPRVNGFTFVKTIRYYKDFRLIPILLFSTRTDDNNLFHDGEVSCFMLKPFNSEEFLGKVKELLNGHPVEEINPSFFPSFKN